MSSSAITTQVAQLKIGSVQNQADSSSVYSAGVWSFKNSTAVTRVTITDAGNVGIGTASPSGAAGTALTINGGAGQSRLAIKNNTTGDASSDGLQLGVDTDGLAFVEQRENNALLFSTNAAERMRIDASGNLLVGAASAYNALAKLQVISSGANNGMLATTDVSNQPPYLSWNRATSGNNIFVYCTTEATGGFGLERGFLYFDRAAGQVKVSATSDERLKTNIKDAPSLLEKVCAIKVREYAWKETGSENIGFIAQELNAVVPRAVWEGEDNKDGTIKRPWSVDNPTLVPYLVKAIQELSAKVDAQAAEIAALKAK